MEYQQQSHSQQDSMFSEKKTINFPFLELKPRSNNSTTNNTQHSLFFIRENLIKTNTLTENNNKNSWKRNLDGGAF